MSPLLSARSVHVPSPPGLPVHVPHLFARLMAQPSRRQRVSRLCGIGGVTDQALCRIVNELVRNPMHDTVSARTCNRAAMSDFDSAMELEITLPLEGAPWTFKWHLCKPCRLVQRCVEASLALRRLFAGSVFMSRNIPRGRYPLSVVYLFRPLAK